MTTHVVVGVEDPGDVFSQVSIQDCLNVAANVNCGAAGDWVKILWYKYSHSVLNYKCRHLGKKQIEVFK